MLPTTEFALLRRVATEQASNRAPSLVAGVVRDGKLVWSGARGFVDGAVPDTDTQYRIGSLTKSFVAVLALRLRDEGKLALTDTVEQHVPGTQFGHLTISALLSHTSGMTAESPGAWWERSPGYDFDTLRAGLTRDELVLRAGRQFHYSNVGYGVLGEVVARHRGVSWAQALQAEVLGPLGLTRTTTEPVAPAARGWAVHPFADVVLAEPAHDAGAMAPAGQLWSTAADLATWTAFTGGRTGDVIHPDTVAEMRTPVTVEDGDSWVMGYGLGFQLVRRDGRRFAGHTGSMPGFLACSMVDAGTGTGALAVANTTAGVAILDLVLELIGIADEHEPALPTPWQPAEIDPRLLELTGLWHWGPAPFHLRVLRNGWLDLAPANGKGRRSRFRPAGEDTWVGLDGYYAGETMRVFRDADGAPRYFEIATFVFTSTPYDASAPIPGGVDESPWGS